MSSHVATTTLVPRLLLGVSPEDGRHLVIEGTVVLVDISGFTVLSERLAAIGRQGTEELIATLSRVFTVLLSSTDDGGDVVKFAGDALLILYRGEGHAQRAAHSAWVMQRVLVAIGDIRLPTARTKLRMSVGVHTGRFDLVLAGDDSVNAVLTGEDTTRVLELQSAAGAGRILVSDETAGALSGRQTEPEPDVPGARRLTAPGIATTESLQALHGARRGQAERFLPRAFIERPDLLAGEPDHRWAAVGFVSVTGLPAAPDDATVDHIVALTRAVEDAVADTGVTLLDIDAAKNGYRYFLTAGAPRTIEDPEGSLAAALLRILGFDTPFALQAGAASGRVFAGFVGAPFRQTYTTMGDATNLAARLGARAEAGTVLATRDFVARSRAGIGVRDPATVTLKGKSQPIPVAVVTAVGERRTGDGEDAPFTGREEEVARLTEIALAARKGAGALRQITGAAGMGKSRLVSEVLDDAPSAVIRVAGERFAARTAYGALRSLLRPLLEIPADAGADEAGRLLEARVRKISPELQPWVALIAPAVGADAAPSAAVTALDDAFRLERTHAVLSELLGELLPAHATIVVEDAQWVDAASAAALASVFGSGGSHALIAVRRDVQGGLEGDGEVLTVGPLDDDDAAMLVEAVAGHSLLASDVAPIVKRAEGNPLYLIELAARIGSTEESLTLEQLVGERIDALSEDDRHLIRRASVLGARVPRALFERCIGPVALIASERIGDFLRVPAPDEGDAVEFRSDLYRDVAYDQLSFQARRELHRAAAAAIEADNALASGAHDAMLSTHYAAIGDWSAASAAARRGAETAERAFALVDAVRGYRAAVADARKARAPASEMRALWEALGRACLGCGRTAEALEAFGSARRFAADAATRARLDRQCAYALNLLGRPDEGEGALRAARRNARAAGTEGRGILATILVTEAAMRLRQARWRDLRRLATEAIALLEGAAVTPEYKAALADAYRYHDIAASELEGDAAMVHLQQALDLYDELGDAASRSKVLNLIGIRAYFRGAWSTAAGLYSQAQDASEAAGDTVGAAIESANAAEILIDQGRIEEARPLLRHARHVFTAVEDTYLVAFVDGFVGRAELWAGRPDVAREAFSQAAARFDELGEVESAIDVRVRAIGADMQLGDLAAARAGIAALADAPELAGVARSQLLRHAARIAHLDGEVARAMTMTREAADAAGSSLYERALCLAQLARWSGPSGALLRAEAETILDELGVVDIPRLVSQDAAQTPAPHTTRSSPRTHSPSPHPKLGGPR